MQYLDSLKEIANELDQQGLMHQADRIDSYLRKIAQEAMPADPMAAPLPADPMLEPAPEMASESAQDAPSSPAQKAVDEKTARLTFLMFKKLQDVYVKHLPDFDYFGKENIKIIQSSFDHLTNLMKTVLRGKTAEYDIDSLSNYSAHLHNIERELERSKKMKITPAKVKIDKFYLYEELEVLVRKLERLYNKGEFPELNPVMKKARSVRDAFANVIKQTSEQIANTDLIEIS